MPSRKTLILLSATLLAASGCQSGGPRMAGLNPFYRPELTSITTPAERVKSLRALAEDASAATPEQAEKLVVDLVRQLETEPDPLLRQALIETAVAFDTPLARKTPVAGLQDADPYVRRVCCSILERSPTPEGLAALAGVAQQDADLDVRLAAVQALGTQDSPAGRSALVAALEDRDPAMQFAGVQAMRRVTGQDLGNSVASYLAFAKQSAPAETIEGSLEPAVELADRRFGWVPR
ncbi:MAG: HEAT repeat domain-containing protein [Planctomycetota bacterium]